MKLVSVSMATAGSPALRCANPRPSRAAAESLPQAKRAATASWFRRPWIWAAAGTSLATAAVAVCRVGRERSEESLADRPHQRGRNGLVIVRLKLSSLASVFAVAEITRKATELSASTFRPLEIFSFVALMYFFIHQR